MQRLVLMAMLGMGLFAGQTAWADPPAKNEEVKRLEAEMARLQSQVTAMQAQLRALAAVDRPRRPPANDRQDEGRRPHRPEGMADRADADKRRENGPPGDRPPTNDEGRQDRRPGKDGPDKDGPPREHLGPPPQFQQMRAIVEKIVGPEKARELHEMFVKQMRQLHESVVKAVGEEKTRELHAAFSHLWAAHRPGGPMMGPPPGKPGEEHGSHLRHRRDSEEAHAHHDGRHRHQEDAHDDHAHHGHCPACEARREHHGHRSHCEACCEHHHHHAHGSHCEACCEHYKHGAHSTCEACQEHGHHDREDACPECERREREKDGHDRHWSPGDKPDGRHAAVEAPEREVEQVLSQILRDVEAIRQSLRNSSPPLR